MTDRELHVQYLDVARPDMVLPIAPGYADWSVARLEDERVVVCYRTDRLTHTERVQVFSPEGSLLADTALPALAEAERFEGKLESTVPFLLPLGFATIDALDVLPRFWDRGKPSLSWALVVFGGLASAALVLAVTRRYAFAVRRQGTWSAFGFLFGIPGVLTLLALEEWPAREECPACAKPRRVDRDLCAACGAAWPAPATDGTEIFD